MFKLRNNIILCKLSVVKRVFFFSHIGSIYRYWLCFGWSRTAFSCCSLCIFYRLITALITTFNNKFHATLGASPFPVHNFRVKHATRFFRVLFFFFQRRPVKIIILDPGKKNYLYEHLAWRQTKQNPANPFVVNEN